VQNPQFFNTIDNTVVLFVNTGPQIAGTTVLNTDCWRCNHGPLVFQRELSALSQ